MVCVCLFIRQIERQRKKGKTEALFSQEQVTPENTNLAFLCFSHRSLDPNVTPLGLCPGRGPAVCDGQASGACGGPLLRGFKLALAELCMDERVKSPAMV